jgi:hypothetical protein
MENMKYESRIVTVISIREFSATILDGDETKTVSRKKLKALPTKKPTRFDLALAKDPKQLLDFVGHFKSTDGQIEISCQESKVPEEASRLSQVSSLSEIDAVDYIKRTTEASHGAKYDIIVGDTLPETLRQFIGTMFKKGLRAGAGEYQINDKDLAGYLMKYHDVLPKKWY